MSADRFVMPATPEEWAAVKPNDADIACAEQHMRHMNDGHEPYAPAVYAWARGMAASRLLEHERCVEVLTAWLEDGADSRGQALAVARRILEDAK